MPPRCTPKYFCLRNHIPKRTWLLPKSLLEYTETPERSCRSCGLKPRSPNGNRVSVQNEINSVTGKNPQSNIHMQNDYVQYAALSALLPSIRSTTSNDPALAVSDHRYLATTPQFALHNPANLHRMRLQTQVQRQMQQINAAIQLLEMQYDSIIIQIQNSACTSLSLIHISEPTDRQKSRMPSSA